MPFSDRQHGAVTVLERDKATFGLPLHQPAMVPQVLEVLHPASGDVVLDLTVGTGGHALALAAVVGPAGLLVGIDADGSAVETARARLEAEAPCPCKLFVNRFSAAPDSLRRAGVEACDVAIADLGVGTHQLLQPQRGFSFDSEEKLDMRYDSGAGPSAWDIVNQTPERELADVFHRFGEERYSRQIAAAIYRRRRDHTIDTPAELSALVKAVVARRTPRRRTWRIHPATRVMMALRIVVNREMQELDALLEILPALLRRGGRVAVLTYHSLEARRVKQVWRRQSREGAMELLTPSPLRPSPEQIKDNPRIRSAQLRAARKP